MSEERPETCEKCGAPVVWCTCEQEPTTGYFYIAPILPNPFKTASLDEIVAQLRACGYRCEAGPLP